MSVKHQPNLPCFVAESTLGKLAHWLRLAGFDTLYDLQVPDARRLAARSAGGRIILTRTIAVFQKLPTQSAVYIGYNAPMDQVRDLMSQLNIKRNDLRPFTRCADCNQTLLPIDKHDARGRVPEDVWQRHDRYQGCPHCGRLFWAGRHASRWLTAMDRWFKVID